MQLISFRTWYYSHRLHVTRVTEAVNYKQKGANLQKYYSIQKGITFLQTVDNSCSYLQQSILYELDN